MAHDIQKCPRTNDVLSNIDILFENDVLIEKEIRKGLSENGFIKESPIQMAAFPYVLNDYDAIVQSKSGTGKSIVFVVTALNKLVKFSAVHQPQTIILAPTREIAVQITDVIRTVGKHIPNLHVDYFIGGTPVERVTRPVHIAVGSPGRIRQLIQLRYLSVDAVRLLVLDEADKLINRAFVEDITWIYSQLPSIKQMLVVSATYSPENLNTLSKYMVDPMFIRPEDASRPLLGVKQLVAMIPVESKNPSLRYVDEEKKLVELLHHIPFTQCVIFSNYQLRPDVICEHLADSKLGAVFLSGAQEQPQRLASLDSFKRGQVRILVTTDLAARGIDAANVDLVINLEVPHEAPTYLHRMGRAGRYGTRGLVITIVNEQSLVKFHSLMGDINRDHEINVGMLPDKLGGGGEGWLQRVEMLTKLDGKKEVLTRLDGEKEVEVSRREEKELAETGQVVKMGEQDVGNEVEMVGKSRDGDVKTSNRDEKRGDEYSRIGDKYRKTGDKDTKTDENDRKTGEKDVKTGDEGGKDGENGEESETHRDAGKDVAGNKIRKEAVEKKDRDAEEKSVAKSDENREKEAKKTLEKRADIVTKGSVEDEKNKEESKNEILAKDKDEPKSVKEGNDSGENFQGNIMKADAKAVTRENVSQSKQDVDKSQLVKNPIENSRNNTKSNEICAQTVVSEDNIETANKEDLNGTSVTSAKNLEPIDFDYINEFINSLGSKDLPNDSPNSTKFIGIASDDAYLIRNMNACIKNDSTQLKSLVEKLDHIDADTLADWILNKHSNVAALFKNRDIVKDAHADGVDNAQDENTNKEVPHREIQSYDSLSMFSPCQTTLNKHDTEAQQPGETNKKNRRNRSRKNNKENKNILNTPTKTRKALNGNERTPVNRNAKNDPLRDDLNATNDEHLHSHSRNETKGSRLPKRDLVVYDDIFSPAANNLEEYEIDYINQDTERKESSDESLYHNDSLDIKLRKKLKAGGRLQRNQRRQSRQVDANQSVVDSESSYKRSSAKVASTSVMKPNGQAPTEQPSEYAKSDVRHSQSRKLSHDDTDFQISWENNCSTKNKGKNSTSSISNRKSNASDSNSHSTRPSNIQKASGKCVNENANDSMNQVYEANFSKLELSAYNDEHSVFLPNSSSEDDTETNEANRDSSESDSDEDAGETNRKLGSVYNESSLNSSCIDLICDDLDEQYARDFSLHRDSQLYNTPRGTPKLAKQATPRREDKLHFKSWIKDMELYNVSTNVNVSDDDGQDESYNMLKTPTPVKRRPPNRENPSDSVGRNAGGKSRNPLLRRALVNKQNQVNLWNQENHGATYAPLGDPFVSSFSNSFNFETDFSNQPQWAKKSPAVRAMSHESHFHEHRKNRTKHCARPDQQLFASSPHHSRKHCASNHAHKIRSMEYAIGISNPATSIGVQGRKGKCVHTLPIYGSQFDPSRMSGKADSKKLRKPDGAYLGADGDTVNATFGDYGDYTYSELNELEDYEYYETHPGTQSVQAVVESEKDEFVFDSDVDSSEEDADDLTEEEEENLLEDSGDSAPPGNSKRAGSVNSSSQSGGSPQQSGQSSYKSISLESYSVIDCIDNPSLDVSWQSASSQVDNSTSGEIRSGRQDKKMSLEKSSREKLSHQSSRRNEQKPSGANVVVSSLKGGKSRKNILVRADDRNYNPYDAAMPGAWQSVPIKELETDYAPDETVYFSEETERKSERGAHKRRDARGELTRDRRFRESENSGRDAQSRQKAKYSASVILGQDRARSCRKHATRNINPEEHRRRRRNESFGNETFDIVDELEGLNLDNKRRSNNVRSDKSRSGKNAKSSNRNHRSSHWKHDNVATSRCHGNSSSSTRTYDLHSNSGHTYDEDDSDCDVCCYENGQVSAPYVCPYENVLRAHPAYYPGLDIARMRRGMDRQRVFMERYLTQMSLYMNVARNVASTSCFDFQ